MHRSGHSYGGEETSSKFFLRRLDQDIVEPDQSSHSNNTLSMLNTPPPSSSPTKGDDIQLADEESKEVERYPRTELEWLATTSFNRAIDYYTQEDDDKCKMWAEKSFVIAQWLEDDGAVRDLLMEKFSGLRWDNK